MKFSKKRNIKIDINKFLENSFPVDVGKRLTNEFKLVDWTAFPNKPDKLDRILSIIKDTKTARKALFEIDKKVRNLQLDEEVTRTEALEKVMNDINQAIESNLLETRINYSKNSIDIVFGAVGYGVSTLLSGNPSLLDFFISYGLSRGTDLSSILGKKTCKIAYSSSFSLNI